MNLAMASVQAEQRMRDVRREVARCRESGARREARRGPGLRRRIGFTLLETGLHLLAQAERRAGRAGNPYPPRPTYRLP